MPIPFSFEDPVNKAILSVSEDCISGFSRQPLHEIAQKSGVALELVIERIQAMLRAGTVRRVRQTLLTTSLAPGALVAWKIPPLKLTAAFEFMFKEDPSSGHVVLRTTDGESPGSKYHLWTTLKVPVGFSLEKHCQWLKQQTGAETFILLPAKKLFALGVGHVRRRELDIGERTAEPGRVMDTEVVKLSDLEWQVLTALKREFTPEELVPNVWDARAKEAGVELETFCKVAEGLNARGLIGRFSTFLEHVKRHDDGQRVTKFNALFHWRVPQGKEMEAGREVGRHCCMTHGYWREGGDEFMNANIMGVSHGMEKEKVLAHKAAIDKHLEEAGIPVLYTNVFWGGRSEIKPSEISPIEYAAWCKSKGIDPHSMKE